MTTEKEWVTLQYNIGTLPSKYIEGDKIPVIYEPGNVTEFMIDDGGAKIFNHMFWAGIVLTTATIIGCIVWKYYFF